MVRIHNSFIILFALHRFEYIEERNILGSCLYKDELHLLERGKCILASNLLLYLNYIKLTKLYYIILLYCIYLGTHTHKIAKALRSQILHKDRLTSYRNALIGYLSINNLKNKRVDLGTNMQVLQLGYFLISE